MINFQNLVISKVSTLQQSIPPDVQSVDITLPENSNKRLWVCNKCLDFLILSPDLMEFVKNLVSKLIKSGNSRFATSVPTPRKGHKTLSDITLLCTRSCRIRSSAVIPSTLPGEPDSVTRVFVQILYLWLVTLRKISLDFICFSDGTWWTTTRRLTPIKFTIANTPIAKRTGRDMSSTLGEELFYSVI